MRDGEIDVTSARLISDADFADWTKKTSPQPYDVLLSRRCNPGETAYVRAGVEFAVGQNLVLLRSNGKIVQPPFLRWLTRGPAWWSEVETYRNPGAVFDSLKCADIVKFKILVPPKGEQERILNLLGALDDKIERNRRMSVTLEAMARALFKSWFVDFDPVRAKAEGRPTGLPDDIAAIFPDSFAEDGCPEGWTTTPLTRIGRFLNGLALQKFEPTSSEPSLPVIKISELRSGPTEKSGKASVALPSDYVIADGDHLFSWSGSLTHCRWTYGKGALNQHLFKVTPLGVPSWLTYQAVEHHLPEFQAIAAGKAVTMGHIQRHHLDEAMVDLPPAASLQAFDNIFAPLHARTLATLLENRTLATLRDTLLPKLISGELRIRDAEKAVAAA